MRRFPSCTFVVNEVTVGLDGPDQSRSSYARVETLNGVRPFHLHTVPQSAIR